MKPDGSFYSDKEMEAGGAFGSKTNSSVGAWGNKKLQLKLLGLTLKSADELCGKMSKTSGWRIRADLNQVMENARMSFSAAQSYYDAKNWDMMLLELSDATFAVEEVKVVLKGKRLERVGELL